MRAVHSTAPAWEEELLLNEDYLYLIQPHTLLLFEVLDLLSPGAVAAGGADTADGWDPVAWAFLRPVGAHNVANTEEVKRLQLWEYPSRGILERFSGRHSAADAASRTVHRLFHSWSGDGSKRKAYPATLHVTVEACPVPAYHQITGRAYRPNEIETGRVPLDKVGENMRFGVKKPVLIVDRPL